MTNRKVDGLTVFTMDAPLEDLKNQIKDRSSWRKIIYGFTETQH